MFPAACADLRLNKSGKDFRDVESHFIKHAKKPWAFKPGDEWHPGATRRPIIFTRHETPAFRPGSFYFDEKSQIKMNLNFS
jgi:hypothetical protein